MKKDALFPNDSIVFLTNRVGRLLANHIRQAAEHESWGLQPQHMGILVDLWQREGVRQQDLAVSNIKDKGTIARALSSLEEANYVVRIPDSTDKRNKLIYLTHKGKALQAQLRPYAQMVMEQATAGLNDKDIAICQKVLSHILKALTSSGQEQ